jgi:deazaflavin-dependent oxidoreductase (nitroreductase family)
MADAGDWNSQVIADFRASGGHPGGPFEGSPIVLLHHRGRRSGTEFIAPVMYLADDADPAVIYVFASKAGAPTNPDWYDNLTTAGDGVVEVGSETYPVEVTDLPGPERDRIYAEQARRYPGFAEYEEKTAGIRTIPVLALRRQAG